MPLCNLKSEKLECLPFSPTVKDPQMWNTKFYVPPGQIPRCNAVYGSDHDEYLKQLTLYEHVIVWRNAGKTRLTLYKRCKVQRNIIKTRLIQHSTHVGENVYKRRLVNYKHI